MIKYPFAERFKAPQGEGLHAGVPMAFVRLVGCSVGQGVCHACDTNFATMRVDLGGGLFSPEDIVDWARPYRHACVTGGEPLDRDLQPLVLALVSAKIHAHVETSGTRPVPAWLADRPKQVWLTVSPKPGYLPLSVKLASEVKVILGGLGDGPGWPTLEDAVRWADEGKLVYVQPRNERTAIDRANLAAALDAVAAHPQLRLSTQLHKFVGTR